MRRYETVKAKFPHLTIDTATILALDKLDTYWFGKNVAISRTIAGPGLKVGDNTYIGGAIISCTEHCPVHIGKFCSISHNVYIASASDHPTSYASSAPLAALSNKEYSLMADSGPVTIGNDVWIGHGAIILKGVDVGDGAIIGAGAVVTKDVDPYSIVAGVPAMVIKMRFPQKIIDQLLRIRWWDWTEDRIRRNADFFRTNLENASCNLEDLIV